MAAIANRKLSDKELQLLNIVTHITTVA